MDLTPLEHVGITIICSVIGYFCGDIYAGAAFGAALFVGRELAQAEQRTIQKRYDNRRINAPWYVCIFPTEWDTASILDITCPVVTAVIICIIAAIFM